MTDHEKELVAALEADVQTWEFVEGSSSVRPTNRHYRGKSLSGSEYAAGLRHRIAEHREQIKLVKKNKFRAKQAIDQQKGRPEGRRELLQAIRILAVLQHLS